jgi:predicted nucleotidyltransferase
MVTEQTIQDLCNRIVQEFRPERIIRFGSYAYGNPTPDSDVDIWVVLSFEGKNFSKS